MYFPLYSDDAGLCIQLNPSKTKLFYLQNKSQSRVLVEVDLTSMSFPKQIISFGAGDITQFAATDDAVYALNKFGVLQFYRFHSKNVGEVSLKFSETKTAKNFCISADAELLALAGAEPKKKTNFKNTLAVYSLPKMKLFCSASFKFEGAVTKMRLLLHKRRGRLLSAVTDTSFSFLLFEVADKTLRLVCKKPGIHFGSGCLTQNIFMNSSATRTRL